MSFSPPPEVATPQLDAAPAPQIPDDRSVARVASPAPAPAEESTNASSETHRCFICLGDEPESALPMDWATPCTCSLEGHQHCLLEWVTDLEVQGKDVKCPLCKSKVKVYDCWDPAVQLSDRITRYFSGLSPLILCGFACSGAFIANAMYGIHALDVFAGPEAVHRYLFTQPKPRSIWSDITRGLKASLPVDQNRLEYIAPLNMLNFLNLSFVGPALILNRLHLGEVVMIPSSMVYAMFFTDHNTDHNTDMLLAWPPTPQKALIAFPTVKSVYFNLHRMLSKFIDKKLEAAVQPRNIPGNTNEEVAANQENAQPETDDDDLVDIQVDLRLGEDDDDEAENDNNPQQDAPQHEPVRAPQRVAGGNAVTSLTNYIAGALLWPSVSYGMGSLLRLVMPKTWVTRPASGPTAGLLQERWGRSLVGGCLFVVLKDAFNMYVKYRKAINRPHRRIQNADRRNRR